MKRSFLPPIAVLAAVLAFAIWNSTAITAHTERWQSQIRQADQAAQAQNWPDAAALLADSYSDWTRLQTYLHIVSEHDAVDDAEAMYRRAMAFAATEEITEFRAEIADLTDQLELLAEMERFTAKNIL